MTSVAVVDYGLCNVDSVRRALEELGASAIITSDPSDLARADKLVLPGVGSFGDAMAALTSSGLGAALVDEVASGAPLLGICLGMQLLADQGDEGGEHKGLGLVPGRVRRLTPTDTDRRIPHIGWNEVLPLRESSLLENVPPAADFYFVHSYCFDVDDAESVVAITPYCGGATAVVQRGRVFGTQFHPEKSQRHGFQVLRNFLAVNPC